MRHGFRGLIFKSFALLLVAATNAGAGGLSVWPLQVNLQDNGAVQELNITNPTDGTTYVQVTAVEWHEPGDADQARRVEDVLAVPPVFELPPNSRQLVRVASRGSSKDGAERAYRLVITEVPRTAGLVPNSLAIAARMTLPLLITPKGAAPKPVWSLVAKDMAKPQLILANHGNASIKVRKVEILNSDEDPPAFSTTKGSLVLAGKEARWPLDIESSQIQGQMIVRAETTAGVIRSMVSLADG